MKLYIKIFESRDSEKSFLLRYHISTAPGVGDKFILENEKHQQIECNENELFLIFQDYFKPKST